MRTFLWRTLAAAAFIGCAAVAYTQAPDAPTKIETIKIADNLYTIYNVFVPGNSTFLVTNEGVILVDDKFPQDGANVLAEIRKVTPQPVKYVINTHHHMDHAGSNETIQKAGAQVISSVNARKNMVSGKQTGQSNITFNDRAQIFLGGEQVDLYYLGRAHTDGDIVALFPKYRLLSSGDLFAYGDETPELIDYEGGGSAIEWTKTLNKALQLDFDRVVPGHGVVTTKVEMTKFRDTSIQLTKRVREMVRAKKSRADVEKMLRAEFHYADVHVMFSLDGLMKEMK